MKLLGLYYVFFGLNVYIYITAILHFIVEMIIPWLLIKNRKIKKGIEKKPQHLDAKNVW